MNSMTDRTQKMSPKIIKCQKLGYGASLIKVTVRIGWNVKKSLILIQNDKFSKMVSSHLVWKIDSFPHLNKRIF